MTLESFVKKLREAFLTNYGEVHLEEMEQRDRQLRELATRQHLLEAEARVISTLQRRDGMEGVEGNS